MPSEHPKDVRQKETETEEALWVIAEELNELNYNVELLTRECDQ